MRRVVCLYFQFLFLISGVVSGVHAGGITKVVANGSNLVFSVSAGNSPCQILELSPAQGVESLTNAPVVVTAQTRRKTVLTIPRFDGPRDRIYSGFLTVTNGTANGNIHYVEEWKQVSKYRDPYPA